MDCSPDQTSITTNHQAIEYCRKHEISPNQLLIRGAKMGSTEEMKIAWLAEADEFKKAFIKSAKYGSLSCSVWLNELQEKLFMEWPEDVYYSAMEKASQHNQIETMIWLYKMDIMIYYEIPFVDAAGRGSVEAMDLIIGWGENVNYEDAIGEAFMNREIESIKAMKKWGLFAPTYLLRKASICGFLEMMNLAKEWGATNYKEARKAAQNALFNDVKSQTVELLTKWEREAKA